MQTLNPVSALPTLIDQFLDEQASLTAVERFTQGHDTHRSSTARYTDLMPATPPGPGQQYAFEVDLDACTGCKACVTACRSLNGLDDDESWRSVGLLLADTGPQHVTMACHHCVDPGCLKGCPVDAYEKDPVTGIVHHLDDQCIGCSYCTLTCPYEVPRYSRARGIVRKCDLCADRLAGGEAPACVQGCPTSAISIRIVEVAQSRQDAAQPWPIAAPSPSGTIPTTTYRSARELSDAEPGDLHDVRINEAHPPLAVMLVLTQVAVGIFLVELLLRALGAGGRAGPGGTASALTGLGVASLALGASTLHLGRPRYAYRAVIGLRHSWLSREILAFGVFAGLAALHAGALLAGVEHPVLVTALPGAVAVSGIAGVACSALIYAVTGRRWWRLRTLGPRFALTTVGGGVAASLAVVCVTGWATGASARPAVAVLAPMLAAVTVVKLAHEGLVLRHLRGPVTDELARTARLLTGALALHTRWRVACGLLGGMLAPMLALAVAHGGGNGPGAALAGLLAVGAVIAGELIERWQMFTASSPQRMPGAMR